MQPRKGSGGPAYSILTVAVGLVLFLTWAYPLRERALSGHNDFLQLYAGATLVGTPELYSIEASKSVHRRLTGTWYPSVYYTRLPFYAAMLSPLGKLPYATAYWTWQSISITILVAFFWCYVPLYRELPLLAALSVPLLGNLLNGQDAGIVMALAGFSVLLVRRGRDFAAGLLLSLCAIKFHLFVLVPVALILCRRWNILKGGLTGGLVLAMVSFAADGLDWPVRFFAMVTNPELHPGPEHMPTLRGLVFPFAGDNRALELLLTALVVALFAWLAWRICSFEIVFGLSLVAGLLVCHHAYIQDCVLLLLPLALFHIGGASRWLRGVATVLVLPPAYFMLLHGTPYNVAVPLLLVSVLLAAIWDTHDGSDRAPAGSGAA